MTEGDRHKAGGSGNDTHTAVLACVGGKGGQGCSMFSMGLASLLSQERDVVLVDLDLNSSHRHILEKEECPGISNLATLIEEISIPSLKNIVQRHRSGFDVLPGLRTPEEEGLLRQVNLNLIFNLLGEAYDLVLLDLSSNHRLIPMGALTQCSLAFLVIQPDLLSLQSALRMIDFTVRCKGGPGSWGLVINRSSQGDLVHPLQAAEVLGAPLLAVLPDDSSAGEDFSNLLSPVSSSCPYLSTLQQMALNLGLIQGSTAVLNEGLPSRLLRALRAWPERRQKNSCASELDISRKDLSWTR